MRGTYDLHTISTPSLYNNIDLCTLVAPFVKEIVGEENLQIDEEPLAGTEDFSLDKPACTNDVYVGWIKRFRKSKLFTS